MNMKTLTAASGLALGALFTLPAGAQTPIPDTPYIELNEPTVGGVQPLDNPTIVVQPSGSGSVFGGVEEVPLPFAFNYYGQNVSTITIGYTGAVLMGPNAGTWGQDDNWAPGGSPQFGSDVDGWVAVNWGSTYPNSGNSSYIGYQVTGTAPQRVMSIEWNSMANTASTFGTPTYDLDFIIRLFEGLPGRIEIEHQASGNLNLTGQTSGMESRNGDQTIEFLDPPCGNVCRVSNIEARFRDTKLRLFQDPGIELAALRIDAPQFASLGAVTNVPVLVENLNGNTFTFDVELEASLDRNFDGSQPIVSVGSNTFTLFQYSTRELLVPMTAPVSLGEQRYFLRAVVDPSDDINEADETNNRIISSEPVRFLPSRPDLEVRQVRLPKREAVPGERLNITVTVANIGSEDVTMADDSFLSMVLSSNPAISPQDAELGRTPIELAAAEVRDVVVPVTLPDPVNSGIYFIGAFLDLDGNIEESNEANNGRASFVDLTIAGGDLAVITRRIPSAILGEPYNAILAATGADGVYTWSLGANSDMLPNNLGLDGGSGSIFGRCNEAVTRNIEVSVRSGNDTASRQFTLTCVDPDEPLTIVTRTVPDGIVGQEYSIFRELDDSGNVVASQEGFQPLVTGGDSGNTANLSWQATGLPVGLEISPTTGLIFGTPLEVGEFEATLTVNDGTNTDDQVLTFNIRDNQNLLLQVEELPAANLGERYSFQLSANGGVGDITFAVDSGNLPNGIVLNPTGLLVGVADQVGQFDFVVRAQDNPEDGSLRAQDRNNFRLVVQDAAMGFRVATQTLPPAEVEVGYAAAISAEGGVEPIQWTLDGVLPEGLQRADDSNELQIFGTPTQADSRNILVTARDALGREASRVLVLRVVEEIGDICPDPQFPDICDDVPGTDGCSSSGSTSGVLLAFLGLGLFGLLRRRED